MNRGTQGPRYPARRYSPDQDRTLPGLMLPVPPRPPWWRFRDWGDAAMAAWTLAGIVVAVVAVEAAVITAGVAVAFIQYLVSLL